MLIKKGDKDVAVGEYFADAKDALCEQTAHLVKMVVDNYSGREDLNAMMLLELCNIMDTHKRGVESLIHLANLSKD